MAEPVATTVKINKASYTGVAFAFRRAMVLEQPEREREAVLLVVGVLEIQHHSFTFTS